jgi:ABC-2 type transport system permease protein
MLKLLRTEWLKLRKYRAFWWTMTIITLTYPGINYIFYRIYSEVMARGEGASQMVKMLVGNPFTFPEVWHTVAYASSLFLCIPSIVVIMFITNEYSFKTHRQNIIDGWSRNQFMAAKLIDVLLIAMLTTVVCAVVTLVIGFANSADATAGPLSGSYYVGLFLLQSFAQLTIAFLLALLIRKAFIALGIFIFYFFPLEPILTELGRAKANDAGKFLPLEISDRLIPVPAFVGRIDQDRYTSALAAVNPHIPHILYTILLTALIWFLCFRINSRRDL